MKLSASHILSLSVAISVTQGQTGNIPELPFFNATTYPQEQHENLTRYIVKALEYAQDDLYPIIAHRCILTQLYPELTSLSQSNGKVIPARPFENLYFVGQTAVSAWAIDTGDGLIVIDALNDATEAETILIPGIESFGFSTDDIKYLFITHEHFDHYGGAQWIQKTYPHIKILASDIAWTTMAKEPETPEKDQAINDGDTLKLGRTEINFYITPGHTNGSVSSIFDVYDNGEKHTVGFYGGMGIPSSIGSKQDQIESFRRFSDIASKAGVDTLVANHQLQDRSIFHFDVLAHRQCEGRGKCTIKNPFVIGKDAYSRLLKAQEYCVRVEAARENQFLYI